MKRMVHATVLAAAILIAAYTGTARAQLIPPGINHQGLVKVNGAPYTGSGSFYFALSLPDGLGGFSNVWTSDGSQMHTSNRPSSPITLSVNEGPRGRLRHQQHGLHHFQEQRRAAVAADLVQ